MKLTLTTHTQIPENWDSNLLKNNSSTGYQISSWGRIYQNSYNSIPLFLQIKNGDGIAAQLMVLIHKEYSWKNASFLADIVGNKLKMKKFHMSYYKLELVEWQPQWLLVLLNI